MNMTSITSIMKVVYNTTTVLSKRYHDIASSMPCNQVIYHCILRLNPVPNFLPPPLRVDILKWYFNY